MKAIRHWRLYFAGLVTALLAATLLLTKGASDHPLAVLDQFPNHHARVQEKYADSKRRSCVIYQFEKRNAAAVLASLKRELTAQGYTMKPNYFGVVPCGSISSKLPELWTFTSASGDNVTVDYLVEGPARGTLLQLTTGFEQPDPPPPFSPSVNTCIVTVEQDTSWLQESARTMRDFLHL